MDGGADAALDVDANNVVDGAPVADSSTTESDADVAGECASSTSTRRIVGVCNGTSGYVECDKGPGTARCPSEAPCFEWDYVSEGITSQYATCSPAVGVCDPTLVLNTCVGNVARNCFGPWNAWEPGTYPVTVHPGEAHELDCSAVFEGGTCEIVDIEPRMPGFDPHFARCVDPSEVPCDPATFVASCEAGGCMETDFGDGVIRPICAAEDELAGHACATLPPPLAGVICLPPDWVLSSLPATRDEVNVACVGTGAILIAQYGYEHVEECTGMFHMGVGGPAIPAHCFTPPDGSTPLCMIDGAELCDVATRASSCVDEMHTEYCHEWQRIEHDCLTTMPRSGGLCDISTGNCAYPPSCVPPPASFVETCVNDSHKWTVGDCGAPDGSPALAPCPNCHELGGVGVTCTP